MGIVVERKGDSTKIETDGISGDVDHAMIYRDRELLAAMSSCGINRIEVNREDANLSDVRYAFEEVHKEKHGEYRWKP